MQHEHGPCPASLFFLLMLPLHPILPLCFRHSSSNTFCIPIPPPVPHHVRPSLVPPELTSFFVVNSDRFRPRRIVSFEIGFSWKRPSPGWGEPPIPPGTHPYPTRTSRFVPSTSAGDGIRRPGCPRRFERPRSPQRIPLFVGSVLRGPRDPLRDLASMAASVQVS